MITEIKPPGPLQPTPEERDIEQAREVLEKTTKEQPEEKDSKTKLYPWGTQWPPPKGAGNYCGEESEGTDE